MHCLCLIEPHSLQALKQQLLLDHLELLVIVDNSPRKHEPFLEMQSRSGKVVYLHDGINKGISVGLNMGAAEALRRGCEWLLTMDQDSSFKPGALEELLRFPAGQERLGIVSPWHNVVGVDDTPPAGRYSETGYVPTSGNVVSLKAYLAVGPFSEKLFIDYVDHEYCLRLKVRGFRICIIHDAELLHAHGKVTSKRFLGKTVYLTHHSPLRRQYMTRNRLYVIKNYPAYLPESMVKWIKELFLLFLFEENRMKNMASIAKGLLDFLCGRYGAIRNPDDPGKNSANGR